MSGVGRLDCAYDRREIRGRRRIGAVVGDPQVRLLGVFASAFAYVTTELGVGRFLARYLRSYARFRFLGYGHWQAYSRIPLEVEARVDGHARGRGASEPAMAVGESESQLPAVDAAAV